MRVDDLLTCGRIHPSDFTAVQQENLDAVPAVKTVLVNAPRQSDADLPVSGARHVVRVGLGVGLQLDHCLGERFVLLLEVQLRYTVNIFSSVFAVGDGVALAPIRTGVRVDAAGS